MRPTTRHGTGQTGEYLAAAELARHGFTVALPTGNAEEIDILARGHGRTFSVQVKSAARGNHQFNLGKFIKVEMTEDGRQTVHGAHQHIDRSLCLVLVSIGDGPGDDEFVWTTIGEFADFLAVEHEKYLKAREYRRKNPTSLHASVSFSQLKNAEIGKSIVDFFSLVDSPKASAPSADPGM